MVNLSHENMATDYAFMQPKFREALWEKVSWSCYTHNTEHVWACLRFSVKVFPLTLSETGG